METENKLFCIKDYSFSEEVVFKKGKYYELNDILSSIMSYCIITSTTLDPEFWDHFIENNDELRKLKLDKINKK